jgi:hypothetical protein
LADVGRNGDVLALAAVVATEELEGGTTSDDAGSLVVEKGCWIPLQDGCVMTEGLEGNTRSKTSKRAADLLVLDFP